MLKLERGVKLAVEVTGNSKEEYSLVFCPNYVQEFGLRTTSTVLVVLPRGWTITHSPRIFVRKINLDRLIERRGFMYNFY
jgi:hypothetical protein